MVLQVNIAPSDFAGQGGIATSGVAGFVRVRGLASLVTPLDPALKGVCNRL